VGALAVLAAGCTAERAGEAEPPAAIAPAATLPAAPLPPERIVSALRREFDGAYPREAPPARGVHERTIVAAPATVEIVDGRRLDVWSYDGQVPGPTLRVRFGETVRVLLRNELPVATTIHWHGVRLPNAMDGVPHVTQPPVEPGQTFLYEFTPKDPGTFWFHPHVRSMEQVERGLYGILIVEDPVPLPYTQDVAWVLDDWRLTPDGSQIDPNFATRSDLAHDGRWGNVIAVNGRLAPELTVRAGERIRLRLLNSANGRVFVPDLWRLDAKLIAVDGMYVERPFKPRRFEMAPGNRLDFDIRFGPQDAGRTIPIFDRWGVQPLRLATIRVLPGTGEPPDFPVPHAAHLPRWAGAETLPPTLELVLNSRLGGEFGVEWTLNDVAYTHAHHSTHAPYSLPYDEWAKLRFTNASARIHPMHMHGVFFKVVSRDGQTADERFWRDTVLVRPRETVEVGLVPWDLGLWMLHCHILEHADSGMMTLVEVARREP
jgi:FtsP/CotA-like multicopper oxidase with cupredoxin domain